MAKDYHHTISPDLIKAYRQAVYEVHAQEEVMTLRVHQVNPSLIKLMKEAQCSTAAFLTAYNPQSLIRSTEENHTAQKKLLADLQTCSTSLIEGLGKDPEGVWSSESSVLALGISLSNAQLLADRYGQNAFVWIGSLDGLVSLQLLHPIAIPSLEKVQEWIRELSEHLQLSANALTRQEIAWLMTVPEIELEHWLNPNAWDLNLVWPLTRPDGSAIGGGTELDRMFKLIAAGLQRYQ